MFVIHNHQQAARFNSEQMPELSRLRLHSPLFGRAGPRTPGRTTHAGPGAQGRSPRVLSVGNVLMKTIAIARARDARTSARFNFVARRNF